MHSMGPMPRNHVDPANSPRVYRAATAGWLTGFLVILGVAVAVAAWGQDVTVNVAGLCGGGALAGLGYALYWRPRLELGDHGIRIVNPLRTVDIPWAAIVDVHTRFAVTVVTESGSHSCFALPAAGAGAALRSGEQGVTRAHPLARIGGAVRTGDLAGTRSGATANDVRSVWQRKVETGELDVFSREEASVQPVSIGYVPAPLTATTLLAGASITLFLLN